MPEQAMRSTERWATRLTTTQSRLVLVAAICALTLLMLAGTARATQPITSFTAETSSTQAGGHPDISTTLKLADAGKPEAAKNLIVDLPQGVFGNPNAVTLCSPADFAQFECPISSQVGLVTVDALQNGVPNVILGTAPVFMMDTATTGETARFGFIAPIVNVPISVPVSVRTGSDYGLRMTVTGISQEIPLSGFHITVWGFPASPVHNTERFGLGSPGEPAGCPGKPFPVCIEEFPRSSPIPVHPLTDNPTTCNGQALTTTVDVETYQDPGHYSHAAAQTSPIDECANESFNPVLNLALTTHESDSPAGLDMQLRAPQPLGFAVSPSEIRSASVALPPGLTINPDAADGQTSCSDAEANLTNESPEACPDTSKIGTFDIVTSALPAALEGSLFFGDPKPGDQYRVIMVASGFGINAKIVASAHPDPATGQVVMSVTDLPQVPFEEFNLHLFSSDRGLMATPTRCTVYQADSHFIPWNEAAASQHSTPTLSINSGPGGSSCPGTVRPFDPQLVAGMSNAKAGAFSSFTLRLDRNDGDQFLGDLTFKMPPGFTGDLRGISYCPDSAILQATEKPGRSEIATPSCPAKSQIGTTNVAAGPGTNPFHSVGKLYLSGPFQGAPLSLAAITPALAGPFDYGTVVVRVALHVDTTDAHVMAISDRVPAIIGGVPIRMRSIQVNIDKPEFTINPTNCSPFSIDSQGIGDEGTVTDFSSYFHVVNCSTLPFKPRMTIRQSKKSKAVHRGDNPDLIFDLRTRAGDANIRTLSVTLPRAFEVDQRHLGNICSKAQLQSERCAGRQPIGSAITETPLIEAPLKGLAYAVSGFGHLPHVVFILAGQVTLIPEAVSRSKRDGSLRTTVPVVPDAPIGHFRFHLFGGHAGYLVNTRSLCVSPAIIKVEFVGQNGKSLAKRVPIKAVCKGNARPTRQRARHG